MSSNGISRRAVLGGITQTSLAVSLFGPALAKAAAIPAHHRTGSIADVEHVVILMQENRSFDHYFGTLNGVRGFADPHPALLPDGNPIWCQPNGKGAAVRPFRFDATGTNFPVMKSLHHDWDTMQQAWNEGHYDRWIEAKSALTMGYLTREDIPYHHALADTFTIGDAYFASLLGPTCPNRLYLMTGSVDALGRGGGPVIDNSDITQIPNGKIFGRGWSTYAERLQQAGVSWRAYRQGVDPASDDDSDGGMNSLLAFEVFQKARPGDPLYELGVAPRRLEMLKEDVLAGRLPQVSWIFPPRIFCEHPAWPPAFGVEYIARILDALTANAEVWSKTVFLLMYDENDGFFDHVMPPVPPLHERQGLSTVSVEREMHAQQGKPFGLGVRVPLFAISPWSRGGFVNSQVFDHTSVIRFLEARFGVHEPNISPWRRAVCGDLTSMFDFATPNETALRSLAMLDAFVPLPDQRAFDRFKAYFDAKPAPEVPDNFRIPPVETGPRRARPLPYDLAVDDLLVDGRLQLAFRNLGSAGAAFTVQDRRRPELPPRRYTVEAGKSLRDSWPLHDDGGHWLIVSGPNGFAREFRGQQAANGRVSIRARHVGGIEALAIEIANAGPHTLKARLSDAYTGTERDIILPPSKRRSERVKLTGSGGWYDLNLICDGQDWRLCGHVETGRASITDPAIERLAAARNRSDFAT